MPLIIGLFVTDLYATKDWIVSADLYATNYWIVCDRIVCH